MTEEGFFASNPRPRYRASAPGRLDVMGGVSDYSGALVLQMPVRERTYATIAARADECIRVHSRTVNQTVVVADPETVTGWAAYVVGCIREFHAAANVSPVGYDVYITSDVPPGRGVSASAALEMATLRALEHAHGVQLPAMELALLGQRAEHTWAGAPCGLMDQLASHCGIDGHVLPILCQAEAGSPAQVYPPIPIDEDWHLVGIDSGVTHRVSGDAYGTARTAAFMGLEILATGTSHPPSCLAEIHAPGFEPETLPDHVSGTAFLEQYGTTRDTATEVRPTVRYPVRAAASHPIYEHARSTRFLERLQARQLEQAGELMYESHASYSTIGLGHPETDQLVDSLRAAGQDRGVYGARITGGGCGGTVCAMVRGTTGLNTLKSLAKHRRLFI